MTRVIMISYVMGFIGLAAILSAGWTGAPYVNRLKFTNCKYFGVSTVDTKPVWICPNGRLHW